MASPQQPEALVLMPPLRARVFDDGSVGLTKKFVEGVEEYMKYWDGPVKVLIEPSDADSVNLDNVRSNPRSLPFDLEVIDFQSDDLAKQIRHAAVVHGITSHRQNHVADLCNAVGVPCVYGTEYSLRTRMQIIAAERTPIAVRLRRYAWTIRQELRQRRAIRSATGVQCNGTPTFGAYRVVNPHAHLYFDTRARNEDLIARDALEARLDGFCRGNRMRLVFSGRLDPMKGTHALPRIADALRRRGVDFELSIFGDGELAGAMAAEIKQRGLGGHVSMQGVLDFRTALAPRIKQHADIFVCTHVQGDPSCTYLETMACGVPIVGYGNEAFAGLMQRVDAGWLVAVNDVEGMAETLARLSRARRSVAEASRNALQFAAQHSFEATFERRVQHFRECREAFNGGK